MRVLIVCLGNICRSPMAHFMLENLAIKKGLDIEVESCGLLNHEMFLSSQVGNVLSENDIVWYNRKSKCISKIELKYFDLILTMTNEQKDKIVDRYDVQDRVKCISEYNKGREVFDPFGMDDWAYLEVYNMLNESLNKLITNHIN